MHATWNQSLMNYKNLLMKYYCLSKVARFWLPPNKQYQQNPYHVCICTWLRLHTDSESMRVILVPSSLLGTNFTHIFCEKLRN